MQTDEKQGLELSFGDIIEQDIPGISRQNTEEDVKFGRDSQNHLQILETNRPLLHATSVPNLHTKRSTATI